MDVKESEAGVERVHSFCTEFIELVDSIYKLGTVHTVSKETGEDVRIPEELLAGASAAASFIDCMVSGDLGEPGPGDCDSAHFLECLVMGYADWSAGVSADAR